MGGKKKTSAWPGLWGPAAMDLAMPTSGMPSSSLRSLNWQRAQAVADSPGKGQKKHGASFCGSSMHVLNFAKKKQLQDPLLICVLLFPTSIFTIERQSGELHVFGLGVHRGQPGHYLRRQVGTAGRAVAGSQACGLIHRTVGGRDEGVPRWHQTGMFTHDTVDGRNPAPLG